MNMKAFKYLFLSLAVFLLFSCGGKSTSDKYTLKVNVGNLKIDSLTIFTFEPQYQKLRILSAGKLSKGSIQMSGHLNEPRVAILKLRDRDGLIYFILEPCETEINISRENVVIWGGELNHEYFTIFNQFFKIREESNQLRRQYNRQLKDSTLTAKLESQILKRDSLLCDSVVSMSNRLMKRNDVVGKLFRDRFFNQLDSSQVALLSRK